MYECIICNYSNKLKSNYNRHNLSNKHIKNTTAQLKPIESTVDLIPNNEAAQSQPFCNLSQPFCNLLQPFAAQMQPLVSPPDTIECKYCDKHFSHRQSLAKHIKYSCKKNKDEDLKELVRLLNLQLEQHKAETMQHKAESDKKDKILEKTNKQLEKQQKQINKLMEKLQVPQQITNNTQNNIQQNNIRLSYKDTDVSHLTHADYERTIRSMMMCVKNIIAIVHLDPNHPENMNIYISNLKDKYIMVYTGETWELKNRQYEMTHLYDNHEMLLNEWLNEFGTRELRDIFKRYLERKDGAFNMIQEEIKLMLYNKRHTVESLGE